MDLRWQHDADQRRWELIRWDGWHTPECIAYVTDEFLVDSAVPVRRLLADHFVIPLPEEALVTS